MKKVVKLYKKISETPLECIERWKKENSKYNGEKATYAGRLDPMAEGELLLLLGEECKKKDVYLILDKEYELDILFGFQTDSFDILGLVEKKATFEDLKNYDLAKHQFKIQKYLEKIEKKFSQKYPPFSSKTIDGEPLFKLKKEGRLDEKKIPEKKVEIYEAEWLKDYFVSEQDFKNDLVKRIMLLRGDFRQEEILKQWEDILRGHKNKNFLVSKIRVVCSSGTYMRSLAKEMGESLGIPALAFKIKRTQIF